VGGWFFAMVRFGFLVSLTTTDFTDLVGLHGVEREMLVFVRMICGCLVDVVFCHKKHKVSQSSDALGRAYRRGGSFWCFLWLNGLVVCES